MKTFKLIFIFYSFLLLYNENIFCQTINISDKAFTEYNKNVVDYVKKYHGSYKGSLKITNHFKDPIIIKCINSSTLDYYSNYTKDSTFTSEIQEDTIPGFTIKKLYEVDNTWGIQIFVNDSIKSGIYPIEFWSYYNRDSNDFEINAFDLVDNIKTTAREVKGLSENNTPTIYAIVIGVSKYQSKSYLNAPINDAYCIATHLRSIEGGAVKRENIGLLLNEKATISNILNYMNYFFTKCDENDIVYFYFSGHGDKKGLLPHEFNNNNQLRYSKIFSDLKYCKAKHKICILDACYAGNFKFEKKGEPSLGEIYNDYLDKNHSFIFISSCNDTEESSGAPKGSTVDMSLFTKHFIKAVEGDADINPKNNIVTLHETFKYVYQKVKDESDDGQHPVLVRRKMEFSIFDLGIS